MKDQQRERHLINNGNDLNDTMRFIVFFPSTTFQWVRNTPAYLSIHFIRRKLNMLCRSIL